MPGTRFVAIAVREVSGPKDYVRDLQEQSLGQRGWDYTVVEGRIDELTASGLRYTEGSPLNQNSTSETSKGWGSVSLPSDRLISKKSGYRILFLAVEAEAQDFRQ